MILTGTIIRKAIRAAIAPVVSPVPVYSIMPPANVDKYIIIQDLAQNQLDEKRSFITQGTISISCVEKFVGRDGDFDAVSTLANVIKNTLTPNRLSTFGNVDGINIFTMYFDSVSDGMFETDPGRTAIVTLRLNYMAQNI
jgi:hypothetical protein